MARIERDAAYAFAKITPYSDRGYRPLSPGARAFERSQSAAAGGSRATGEEITQDQALEETRLACRFKNKRSASLLPAKGQLHRADHGVGATVQSAALAHYRRRARPHRRCARLLVHPPAAQGRHRHRLDIGSAARCRQRRALLGQHALGYAVLAFLAFAVHRRILWFPLWQQALHLLLLLLSTRLLTLAIRIVAGAELPGLDLFFRQFHFARRCVAVLSFLLLLPQRLEPVGREQAQGSLWPMANAFSQIQRPASTRVALFPTHRHRRVFVLPDFSLLLLRLVPTCRSCSTTTTTPRPEDNRISIVPIMPNRGLILDRSGTVLARNYSAYTLEISPGQGRRPGKHHRQSWPAIVEVSASDRTRFKHLMIETKGGGQPADPHSVDRRRGGQVRCQSLSLRRCGHSGAAIPPVPIERMASHLVGYIRHINDRDVERMGSGPERQLKAPTT